jgi:hypothetical protein
LAVAGITEYRLDVSLDNFASYVTGYQNLQVNGTSRQVTGLIAGNTYQYRVRAINVAGNSLNSNVISKVLLPANPQAPSSLIATTISSTQIVLNWQDNSSNENGFEIWRSTTSGSNFVLISTTPSNIQTFSDNPLNPNTAYYYNVRSFNAGGVSIFTEEAFAQTLPQTPFAANNLTATVLSSFQIELKWKDNSDNETGFVVERSEDPNAGFVEIAFMGANTTAFLNTGLTSDKQYYYRVKAQNEYGNSPSSNIAGGKTADIPSMPQNLAALAISSTQIDISWTDASNNETGFSIEFSNILSTENQFIEVARVDANVTNYQHTGLAPFQTYLYRIRALNDKGTSPYTPIIQATTLEEANALAPNAPKNLQVEPVSESQISLSWKDDSNNEDIFIVEISTDGVNYSYMAEIPANITSFIATGLVANIFYSFRVKARSGGGDSPYSNPDAARAECNILVLALNETNTNGSIICKDTKDVLLTVNTNVTQAQYQWKKNNINIPDAHLPFYYANRTGSYTCEVVEGNCVSVAVSPVIVIVEQPDNAFFDLTIDVVNDELFASVSGADQYQWFHEYEIINGATDVAHKPTKSGSYFVMITDQSSGCTLSSQPYYFQVTGLEDFDISQNMQVFPNPTTGILELKLDVPTQGKYNISLIDAIGKKHTIFEGEKKHPILNQKIHLENKAVGLYFLELKIGNYWAIKKVLLY